MIKVINGVKEYNNKKVLDIKELEIISSGIVYIKGKSGIGKTTLINCLFGLDSFNDGKIYLNDKEVKNLMPYSSFVFQDFQLFDRLSVFDNLNLSKTKCDIQEVENVLKKLDIYEVKDKKAYNISAGQKQRVALARTILQNRDIIILDEPISNLDEETTEEVLKILKELSKTKLIIIVSHESLGDDYYDQKIEIKKEGIDSLIVNNNKKEVFNNNLPNKLSLKKAIKCSFSLKNKLSNKIATTLIVSICLFFACLLSLFSLQNKDYQNYYGHKSLGVKAICVAKFIDSKDEHGIEERKYYSIDDKNNHELYYTTDVNEHIKLDNKVVAIDTIWYPNNDDFYLEKGKYSLKENELLVSKDIYEKLDKNSININNDEYKVVDYFDLGVTNTILFSKKGYSKYCKEELNNCRHLVYIKQSNNTNNEYYCSISYDANDNLLTEGRYPVSLNEIAIRKREMDYLSEYISNNQISLTFYSNTYRFDGNNISNYETTKIFDIVGYLNDDANDFLFTEEVFYDLGEKCFEGSIYNSLNGYVITNPSSNDFKNLRKNGLISINEQSSLIESQINDINNWVEILPYILLGFSIVSFLSIFIYISSLINYNQKEFGILVSLNYKRNILVELVFIQTIAVAIISILFGLILSWIATGIINTEFVKYGGSKVLYFVPYLPIIVLATLFIVIGIIIAMSYISLKRKNNIELIYGKDK